MKIAIISTPWISVPPVGYGGTELVVYNLTEGLVKKGHEVTLFATGDSKTSARLEYFFKEAVGNNYFLKINSYYQLNHIHDALNKINQGKFDIIHNHNGRIPSFFLNLQKVPFVHTLHGSYNKNLDDDFHINKKALESMVMFKNHNYVSISDSQRKDLPELNYVATVYNCLNIDEFPFDETGAENMVWLGRISRTKGLEKLIETAKAVKKPLKISEFVDEGEKEYFKSEIEPLFSDPLISAVGEIKGKAEKSDFLKKAKLFLFPINWDEPFGIVMIEAMASGTPVVAFARGSVPEVVRDGINGFIVNFSEEDRRGDFIVKKSGLEGLKEAIEKIYSLPEDKYLEMRKNCRKQVEDNFTVAAMVDKYEKIYERIISGSSTK